MTTALATAAVVMPATEKVAAPIGVTIATPFREFNGHQDLPAQIGRTMRQLSTREDANGYRWTFLAAVGGMCRARNSCVHEFLKSDDTWLLWWDRDLHEPHGHEADAILRLLAHRQPIVGGMYCKRVTRPTWVATFMPAAEMQPQARGLLQVAELGGGFKLIHRKVFIEIRRIFGEIPLTDTKGGAHSIIYRERESGDMIAGFYQNLVIEGDLMSEDYFLDYLCRCVKVPILADTQVLMQHVEPDGKRYPASVWPPIPAEGAS